MEIGLAIIVFLLIGIYNKMPGEVIDHEKLDKDLARLKSEREYYDKTGYWPS